MNQGRSFRGVCRISALCCTAATLFFVAGDMTRGQSISTESRRGVTQPLDGPNFSSERDLMAGSLVDSFFEPLATDSRINAATKALGGKPSKASIRPQWTARLARNPKKGDGNPPYVLIDRYGGIQRFVETTPQIDLERYVGQQVSVRRDTGHTLLASQLELPKTARRTAAAPRKATPKVQREREGVELAAFEEATEPTPADAPTTTKSAESAPLPTPQGEIIEGEVIEGGPMMEGSGEPMIVPEGVDPLYLDDHDGEESRLEGCPHCGSALCKMQGGCGFGSRPIFYARGEYLLWWMDGMDTPPLVVRGVVNNNNTPADATDDFFDEAVIVFGGTQILDEGRSGGRVRLGYWLDDYGRWAIEGEFLSLGQVETNFIDGGDGTFPIVGRPFIDPRSGEFMVEDVSFPGVSGTVTVNTDSSVDSAGLWLRRSLCCTPGCNTGCGDAVTCGSGVCGPLGCGNVVGDAPCLKFFQGGTRHVDMTYGVRWAQLQEGLNIQEDLTMPTDTTFLNDNFSTSNRFIGGELGFMWDWQRDRWSLELLSKLALGSTRQEVSISGFTFNGSDPDNPAEGGLLAQSSNIGFRERDVFSVLPQIGITCGYLLTDRLRLTGGYTFMYWSRVVRPGDQIDLEVNPELIPPGSGDGLPAHPQFVFRDTDIWIQGINVGLEYQW
jgi:hypothetical protein